MLGWCVQQPCSNIFWFMLYQARLAMKKQLGVGGHSQQCLQFTTAHLPTELAGFMVILSFMRILDNPRWLNVAVCSTSSPPCWQLLLTRTLRHLHNVSCSLCCRISTLARTSGTRNRLPSTDLHSNVCIEICISLHALLCRAVDGKCCWLLHLSAL